MCHPAWSRERTAAHHLTELARLRRIRDRIDRDYPQPLNIEALAREANMPPGHLSRQFHLAYGQSPYAYVMSRRTEHAKGTGTTHTPVRIREAPAPTPDLA
ncbi:hypothetical protein ACFWY6_18980 [Streptomyces sp. NPDC059037]|uniref:hypothetical protein n=1 Tax=Streptomyces sp. NPDC059037 TaxID=3346710 RepID=UPI0036AD71AB